MANGNDWSEYQKLVMTELKRLTKECKQLADALAKMHVEIAVIKVRAGFFGALAGSVPSLVAVLVMLLK